MPYRYKKLSIRDRQRIIDLSRNLKPKWKNVALQMKRQFRVVVTPKTCTRIWAKWAKTRTVTDSRRTGRPLKCTKQQEREICRIATRNRFQSLPKNSREAVHELGVSMCPETVRTVLAKHDLHRRVAARKPLLSAAARQKRLQWAQEHSNWPLWKWRRCIFSDEKIFRSENQRRSLMVTRKKDEKFHPACIQHTVKHAIQAHVWGAVGWHGGAPLKLVQGNLNAVRYQTEVIHDLAVIGREIAPPDRPFVFQHDMAPAHHAATTRAFLQANRIDVMDWPGNSPDLNIIENVWAWVSSRMGTHSHHPANTAEMFARVQEVWATLPLTYLRKLFKSMPARVRAVIDADGGPTRY